MRLLRVAPFVAVGVAWWLVADVGEMVPGLLLPTVESVVRFWIQATLSGQLVEAVVGSVWRFGWGLSLGLIFGASLALIIAGSRVVSSYLLPVAKFFQAIAGVAWIPLAVLWFGITSTAAVFIIFNTTFFVVLYATLSGVRGIDANLSNGVRTLGGSQWDVFKQVILPGALPHLIGGVRVAVGYGWRALIAAEIIAAGLGLGVLIWEGQRTLRTPVIVGSLLIIGAISYSMNRLIVTPLERRTVVRWGTLASSSR